MASAEQKLHDHWGDLEHAHAEHRPERVIKLERGFYFVKCECGEVCEIPMQDVLELSDPPAPDKTPPPPLPTPSGDPATASAK